MERLFGDRLLMDVGMFAMGFSPWTTSPTARSVESSNSTVRVLGKRMRREIQVEILRLASGLPRCGTARKTTRSGSVSGW